MNNISKDKNTDRQICTNPLCEMNGNIQDISAFYLKKGHCKKCISKYNQNPERKAKQKEYSKKYGQSPKRKKYNQSRERKAKQKEYSKERTLQYKTNPEAKIKAIINAALTRSRKKNIPYDRQEVLVKHLLDLRYSGVVPCFKYSNHINKQQNVSELIFFG